MKSRKTKATLATFRIDRQILLSWFNTMIYHSIAWRTKNKSGEIISPHRKGSDISETAGDLKKLRTMPRPHFLQTCVDWQSLLAVEKG